MATPFNERLKQLRETAGMTQEALARAAGMSTSTISKLEQREDMDPTWSTVRKLTSALGLKCGAFEDEAEAPPADQPAPPAKGKRGKAEAPPPEPPAPPAKKRGKRGGPSAN